MRETAVESQPFRKVREKDGHPAQGNDRGTSVVAKSALIARCSGRTMD
jgi:hypothetical protein